MDLKGLSIEDIMNMDAEDLVKLSRSELAKITGRLVSAGNKRIRRLAKTDIGRSAPSYIGLKGRTFSVKGKNVNELRNEFKKAKTFLRQKTSTATGWREVRQEVETRLGGKLTKENASKFWETYRRLQEANAGGILDKSHRKQTRNTSDRIQKKLYNVLKHNWDMDEDRAISIMEKKIKEVYEREQQAEEDL